jgi:hypothetical protein
MEFSTSVHSTMVFLHIIVTKDWIKSKERAICIQLRTQPSHSTNGLTISTHY